MDKTKGKNKRTVPIHYQQTKQTKYRSTSKKTDLKKDVQKKNEIKINDNQQNYDNDSNQQYMQSSYQQKYSQKHIKMSNQEGSYYQEDLMEQKQKFGFDESKKLSKKSTINHYELTFKKKMQQNEDESNVPYEQSSKMYVQKSAENGNDFQDESQSFQQVQYGKNQPNKTERFRDQFSTLDSLIENRQKLYQKYHSALINFYYLHSKTNKNIEEKHKQYLLSLLVQQLQKNIFINGLKMNYHRVKAKQQSEEEQEQIIAQTKPKLRLDFKTSLKNDLTQIKESKKEKQKQKEKQIKKEKNLNQSYLQQMQAKLVIFEQITYGIVRKKLFECFDCLVTKSRLKVHRKYQESHGRQDSNNLDDHSQPEEEHYNQQPSSQMQEIYESLKSQRGNKTNQRHLSSQQASNSIFSNKQQSQSKSLNSKSKQPSSLKSKIHQLESYNHSQSHNLGNYQQQQDQANDQQEQQQGQVTQNEGSFNSQEQENYRKLQELINYIHSLKHEALRTDSQLKRYFIKWKIYMLQLILQEYHQQQQDLNGEDYYQGQEQENSQFQQNQEQEQQPSYLDQENNFVQEIYSSNPRPNFLKKQKQINSHNKSPLKNKNVSAKPFKQTNQSQGRQLKKLSKISHQSSKNLSNSQFQNSSYSIKEDAPQDTIQEKTLILKSFLYENYLHEFWNHFSQLSTQKKLMIVSKKLRQQNLKKNVLIGLELNIEWRQKQRAMTEYYHQIAQQQDITQYRTAQLFYKTNLKTKYFFQFVKTCRQVKSFKKLDSMAIKVFFNKIYNYADSMKRKQFNIQRFFMVQRNKRLFKSFRAWKDSTILSPNYLKLKTFCQRKDSQILSQYFSILQIFYKQSLIQQKKATNFYKAKQTQKVFKYLDFLSKQSRETRIKQRELRQYLTFSKGKQFYDSFYQFYGEKVLQHRMKIRAQKLFYSRQKDFIFERLQEWRNFIIKKQSYQAIQYRLVKLRQKQVKQNIFNIWLEELDKRINKKDELEQSAQHKDWLVKYYGSLCEIATSGKMTN